MVQGSEYVWGSTRVHYAMDTHTHSIEMIFIGRPPRQIQMHGKISVTSLPQEAVAGSEDTAAQRNTTSGTNYHYN